MILRQFAPSPPLASVIRCYYLAESDYPDGITDVFFADGCVEVVFHMGVDFFRNGEKEPWAKIIGQITQPLTMKAKGKGRTFGIWFRPHTFSLLFDVPLVELSDKAISLEHLFDPAFLDYVGNCLSENDMANLLTRLEQFLIARLKAPNNLLKNKIAEFAVYYISKNQAESNLTHLAKSCNISNRYLEKIFLEKIGLSPRHFIRIVRFQQALRDLSRGDFASLTSLSYQAGYYDQAHFIRDFRTFTGFTPSEFRPERHPINQYFLSL